MVEIIICIISQIKIVGKYYKEIKHLLPPFILRLNPQPLSNPTPISGHELLPQPLAMKEV